MFSVAAIVAIVGTFAPVATLGAASYSDELQGAYDYALTNGITTQSSIDTANMYGSLLRSHMAKMMVNYAKEVKGLTADTSLACNFTDVANQTDEMKGYIKEACQMGLMGQGITAFNPNGIVTRAQFGTVLSRILYGTANDGGDPYYTNHLAALKDAGIMNNISNPNAPEVRGYVMLMMQRSAEGTTTTPTVCTTPENVLSCSLGLDTCPAECVTTTPVVKAGSLTVSLNSNSLANGTQIPSTGTIRFATVNFVASSSDVSLNTLTIKKIGLAAIPSSTRVWFEKDGIRVSGKAAFSSDGTATISFAPAYVVKAGNTENLDLYVQLATYAGQDFQFTSNDINSTAENTNGSFTTPTLRTAQYTVAPIDLTKTSVGSTYTDISSKVELGAFSIQNNDTSSDTRDVAFESITLRQNGNADLNNLSNITLERNGLVVASNPVVNTKDLTFSINDTIKDGSSATYYIKAMVKNVDNQDGDTYQFNIRNTTDVNASEVTTNFRSTVTLASATASYNLNTYTVQGGDLSFTRDTTVPLSMNYAAGSQVVLMKGTITAKNSITLEDVLALGYTGTYPSKDLSKMFSTIYLTIGNSTFSYSPTSGDTTAAFLGSATVNGTAQVRMYATLKDTAPSANVKFDDLKLLSFNVKTYAANGNNVTISGVGSIGGIQVTAQTATLNVTRTDALGNTAISAGSNGLTVYGLRLSSTQGNGVTLSNMVLTASGYSAGFSNNAYVTLYINGTAVQSKTVSGSTITFDGFSKTLNPTTPMDVVVKADFVDAFNTGAFQLTLSSLNAYDTLTSNAVTGYAKPAGAVFTIGTAAGTLATSSDAPLSKLFLSPSTAQKIGAFKVSATNDGVRLYDVAISGTALDNLTNFRLVDTTGTVIATATTNDATNVVFSQINNTPVIAKDTTATYYVVADVNSSTNVGGVAITIKRTGTTIKGSNGNTIAIGGTDVINSTHAIADSTITIVQALNPNKEIGSSALRFTVTAQGKNSVLLTGLTAYLATAGYSGNMVQVYKDSVTSANLAFSGAYTNGATTLALYNTGKATVDVGTPVTYIMVLDSAIGNGTNATQSWTAKLTDANFAGYLASTYNNVATFPLTEVK